jgi:hypothetical protein
MAPRTLIRSFRSPRTARRSRSLRPALEQLEPRRLLAFDPTGVEQELLQLTNRFRTDPRGEFNRLMVSASPAVARDKHVDDAVKFFRVDGTMLRNELAAYSAAPPLAWHPDLLRMARDYTQLMITQNSQSHDLGGSLGQRLASYGFNGTNMLSAGENLFKSAFSPVHAHAGFVIDWGVGPGGMQSPRGHRDAIMRGDFTHAGTGLTPTTHKPDLLLGPFVSAEELVALRNHKPLVVGAVFRDLNSDGWYTAGEGLAGVTITLSGPSGTFATTGWTAGGYQLEIPAGTYTATASGAALRFPITIQNVQVGTRDNVWLNFLYDPNFVPADALEPNNSRSAATLLSGNDQSLSGLSIHPGDIDYFKLIATTQGSLLVDLTFQHALGDLNLRLQNASGTTLLRSTTTSNRETLQYEIQVGSTYYIVVESASGGTGGPYTLKVDTPPALPPVLRKDNATAIRGGQPITIDVLANDSDPDGPHAGLLLEVVQVPRGRAEVVDRKLRYTPPDNFTGLVHVRYRVTDVQGLSRQTDADVIVLDLSRPAPFLHPVHFWDTSADGVLTALDALLVINELNRSGARPLPTTAAEAMTIAGFVDSNGDGFLTAFDALLIINRLNGGSGEGEPVQPTEATAPDAPRRQRSASQPAPQVPHPPLTQLRSAAALTAHVQTPSSLRTSSLRTSSLRTWEQRPAHTGPQAVTPPDSHPGQYSRTHGWRQPTAPPPIAPLRPGSPSGTAAQRAVWRLAVDSLMENLSPLPSL